MGLKKEKERALFKKKLVLPQKEEDKSVRTCLHGRHFPDIP
jgi:hypothetical protein